MKKILFYLIALLPLGIGAQNYTDFVGGGHSVGMTVTASHSTDESPAMNTLDGKGLDNPRFEAGRFLAQSTMGPTDDLIQQLLDSENDFEGWIDAQFNVPSTHTTPMMDSIWSDLVDFYVALGREEEDLFGPYSIHFDYAYWQNMMTNDDHLRYKIAEVLSQILVISEQSDIGGWGESMSGYYDMLLDNAFGNYRDILEEVTYSFQMGYYLSHFNNAKGNPDANTSPDENYAREIMQLFSIGLFELNQDGSLVLDGDGNSIPTYGQDEIQEFAKIFTGLGVGVLEYPDSWPYTPFFGLGTWAAKKDEPMVMYEDFHETSEKFLLNGLVIPANQTGDQDISDALDNLFNHPNVGPFIGTLMIKRLVKSNPTPAYVERVAMAFNDNGNGERGDMKAVIKAILLDEEARSGAAMFDPSAGRAKEPFSMYTAFARGIDLNSPSGRIIGHNVPITEVAGQGLMRSPTVFNFYLPNHQPVGPITDAGLTSPELKLHNTSSAVTWPNMIYAILFWESGPLYNWESFRDLDDLSTPDVCEGCVDFIDDIEIDFNQFMPYHENPEILVNEIDKVFTYGQLSEETRNIIVPILDDYTWPWNDDWREERVRAAIYFVLFSPDFNTMR